MAGHPLADRLGVFREMASDARRRAARAASGEMRLGYENLARSWDQLIGEIEAAMTLDKRR
jgi:hypothetical protein